MSTDLVGSGKDLMGIGSGGSSVDVGLILLIFGIIILVGIIAAIVTFVIVIQKQYKIKIRKYERINGRFQEVGTIKAKVIPIGTGGDSALLLKKPKKLLPMPTLQTGVNTYLYFVSDDGEWINFSYGDFDENRKEMGAFMLDREMRYARTSLQNQSKERYDETSFLQKYGGLIAYSVLIICTAIGFWLLIDQMIEVAKASAQAVDASKDVLIEVKKVLGALDNVKGGSGIKQL